MRIEKLWREAITRIRDIANELVGRGKNTFQDLKVPFEDEKREKLSPQLLADIVDGLASEKRMLYRARVDLEIETLFNISSYGLFANIGTGQFKRVLSNIINNAAEAIEGPGEIIITLSADRNNIFLNVKDTSAHHPH